MTWIKSNKALAGFFAVATLLTGLLAFLVFRANEKYEADLNNYTSLLGQLNGLQRQSPYPDEVTLKALRAQKREHKESIAELQRRLSAMELPLDPLTEVQFQDALRDTVQRVSAKAAASGMKLPEKFYMGFDEYQGAPPRREAAPALGRELKAIESIILQLAESGVACLTKLDRAPLPDEASKLKSAPSATEQSGGKGGRGKGRGQLAAKAPFEVSFISTQSSFRAAFNNIVSSREQFFIPRSVQIRNEKDKGPLKVDALSTAGFPAGGTPGASRPEVALGSPAFAQPADQGAASASPTELRYIVGDEKIEVTLLLELVDFDEGASK